jgi:hypothetical protein
MALFSLVSIINIIVFASQWEESRWQDAACGPDTEHAPCLLHVYATCLFLWRQKPPSMQATFTESVTVK